MDLLRLQPSERIIDIIHPGSGEPLGIKVSVVSVGDERTKKVKRRILDEKLRLESRGKSFKSEDFEENTFQILYATMTGWEWSGEIVFDGAKPDFNVKNVRMVFDRLPWFRAQIEEAVADETAFF